MVGPFEAAIEAVASVVGVSSTSADEQVVSSLALQDVGAGLAAQPIESVAAKYSHASAYGREFGEGRQELAGASGW